MVKIVILSPKESFKTSSIRTAIAKVLEEGRDFFPIREEDSQGPLETGGKIFVYPSNKLLRWIFNNCFSCSTQNGAGFGGKGSREGGQNRVGNLCVNQEILRPTCHIQLHPWLQPLDGYLGQAGWLDWAASVLLNHPEGRLGTWPWGSWVPRVECRPTSQLMTFVASHFKGDLWFGHSLAQCPTCLQIRHLPGALSFKDSGFSIELPGKAASIWAWFVSFSPFPGPWPPFPVLCYKRCWWLSGPSHLKRHQGPAAVAVYPDEWCPMGQEFVL